MQIQVHAGKHVTGHAGHGNMKVFEIFGYKPEAPEPDFDLHDDLIFFMNNDPEFYRGEFYPFLVKFKRHCEGGRSVRAKAFEPMVTKAYDMYKNKFPVNELEENLSQHDLKDICEKIQGQSLKDYHDEKRKDREQK